jgi:electron transport complex protein RnfC
MRLSPVVMNNALNADDLDEAVNTGLLDCIECGSCTYMCPARIKLTQRFRAGKLKLKNLQQLTNEAQEKAKKAADAKAAYFKTEQPAAPPPQA